MILYVGGKYFTTDIQTLEIESTAEVEMPCGSDLKVTEKPETYMFIPIK